MPSSGVQTCADRKSTRLNSSHTIISYAVFCLKKKQETLYAQDRWGILLSFQAMDAAGKDGAIKHFLSGVDPKGCQVFFFNDPATTEIYPLSLRDAFPI